MADVNDIRKYLYFEGYDPTILPDHGDIFETFDVVGPDAVALMEKFGIDFNVNLQNYHWYLHMAEDAESARRNPPFRRPDYVPTSILDLVKASQTGKWIEAEPTPDAKKGFELTRGQMAVAVVIFIMIIARIYLLFR